MEMLERKKILIIRMGIHRDDNSYEKLGQQKSALLDFVVARVRLKLNNTLKEDGDVTSEIYDTKALADFMLAQNELRFDDYDLVLGCIDRPINGDEQILAEVCKDVERNKFYILSTTNIMERLNSGNVTLLNFLLNIIYGMYTRKYLGIDPEYHESPGCILDYCYLERDLIEGCIKPALCEECAAEVQDPQTATVLNRELKKIRVPLYIRLIDHIKQRTVLSMTIAIVASLFFGIITNIMSDVVLSGTVWQSVVTSTVPLVILCFLIAPFLSRTNK